MTSDQIRSRFPALASDWAFMENAGGSQVPISVIEAVSNYYRENYVQVGAGYPHSDRATQTVADAHRFTEDLMGVGKAGKAILGSSTTQLFHTLAHAYSQILKAGDEIVIANNNHESNIGAWLGLEKQGIKIRYWEVDPVTGSLSIENLVLTGNTKLVCFPHASNLIGEVIDVAEVTRVVHAAGGRVVVDGVAYAPHDLIEVEAWKVDWYCFSAYKVYGPHFAALFGRNDALAELHGPNHFFINETDWPYKFELGCLPHELLAGWLGLRPYLTALADEYVYGGRKTIKKAIAAMRAQESPLVKSLYAGLANMPRVRLLGPSSSDHRVGTLSFVVEGISSAEVVDHVHKERIAIRNGHMYAHRLCEAIGIAPEPGVVRVSVVHTNTAEEVDRFLGSVRALVE